MSILEELYYGNIAPWERTIEKNSERHKISEQIIKLEDKLFDVLNNDEKELYNQIATERHKRQDIAEREIFVDGFRLGAQLIMDILSHT